MSDHNKHCDCVPEMAKAIAVRDAKIADLQADVDALRAEAASEERWADEYHKQAQVLQAEVDRLRDALLKIVSVSEAWDAMGILSLEEARIFQRACDALEGGE